MTILTGIALDELDRIDIKANVSNFLRYARGIDIHERIKASQRYIKQLGLASSRLIVSKSDTVSPLPEPTELDMSFIPKTDTQKRTRKASSAPKKKLNTNARCDVLAAIAEHGPLTKTEIAEKTGATFVAIVSLLQLMVRDNLLYIVGQKVGARGQRVNVYHTDPACAYVEPNTPKQAPPPSPVTVIEEKRAARIPSVAAVDRGQAVIRERMQSDALACDMFKLICQRPRSAVELMHQLHAKQPLDRLIRQMEQHGIIENIGKETTVDRLGRKHYRAVYAVKEAEGE